MPPMVASMYLPALNYIREDLNTTNELLALTVSLYTLVVGTPLIATIVSQFNYSV